MGSDRDVDDAIDRAVRQIMSIDPRAGLRGRVLNRLERPDGGWHALPRLAAAAALAIVAVAFVMMRSTPEPVAPSTIGSRTAADPVAPPVSFPEAAPAPVAPPGRPRPAQPRPAQPRPATDRPPRPQFPAPGMVAAAAVGDTTLATDTGEAVDPLPLPAGAPTIIIKPIQIDPLTIEPIVVAPIPPPR